MNQPETARELASLAVNAGRALQDEKRHYEIACKENARLRAVVARIHQMVDAWEQRLPETIRTATAVDAIRTALGPAVSSAGQAPTDRAATLTPAERQMLTYALDQAQEHIWSRDGFTDDDQAAVDSLRRLADETPDTQTQADEPVVTVHAAPDLSPAASEALGALVGVAKAQAVCDFEHPHPEHPCGRRTAAGARQDGDQT